MLVEVEGGIFFDVHRVEEGSPLKEHSHVLDDFIEIGAREVGDPHAVDVDRARFRLYDPDDLLQEHALSNARSSEDYEGFSLLDVEVEPFQDLELPKFLVEAADRNHCAIPVNFS